jgi:putative Mg2+ transporter-C (MgtC) family protein
MIPDQEIILRIVIAALLGAFVGFERERQGQPAGLRTHIILVVGATLTMTLSINLAIQFRPLVPNGDPARLAAQVVSGIGFLGAGAILRYGPNIKGLTTAASLWTMAVVGLAVGAGHFLSGVAATALILMSLIILNVIEKRYINTYTTVIIQIAADDRKGLLDDIHKTIGKIVKSFGSPSVQRNLKSKRMRVEYTLKLQSNVSTEYVLDMLSKIDGIRAIKIS